MRYRIVAFLVCCLPIFCAAQQKTEITSDRVNAALAQLDPYIQASLAKTKVPGAAVAVIYNDKVVFLRGYGIRKVGEPREDRPGYRLRNRLRLQAHRLHHPRFAGRPGKDQLG